MGNAQIWNESDLKEAVDLGQVDIPRPDPLPQDNEDVSYFFIGEYIIYISAMFSCYLTFK